MSTTPLPPFVRSTAAGVELRGVERSYGPVHALRGIDLDVAPGETVAILGPNGAGKSTTIDMILGLGEPDVGTVHVFGMPPSEAIAAGAISAMLQTGQPIRELSVRELVAMVASLYPHPMAVDDALALTGLTDIADRRTQKLSGGQQQRVRFATAVVADADLLVLDEPTVALDVEGRNDFWTTMRSVAAQGKTVLFATHYLEEADAFADRIVVMAGGTIIADGGPTEIKARVGRRTIRATLADVEVSDLATLPGVTAADRHGDVVLLTCDDSDAALRALLARQPTTRDIEVKGAGLEEAFLELTSDVAGPDHHPPRRALASSGARSNASEDR